MGRRRRADRLKSPDVDDRCRQQKHTNGQKDRRDGFDRQTDVQTDRQTVNDRDETDNQRFTKHYAGKGWTLDGQRGGSMGVR